jgi:hypothetical protein
MFVSWINWAQFISHFYTNFPGLSQKTPLFVNIFLFTIHLHYHNNVSLHYQWELLKKL